MMGAYSHALRTRFNGFLTQTVVPSGADWPPTLKPHHRRNGRALATLAGATAIVLVGIRDRAHHLDRRLAAAGDRGPGVCVAALPTPLIWWVTGTDPRAAFREPASVWLLTVIALLGYHASLYNAVQKAPAAPAALLQGCTPLLIVVGSALLPGERLRWWHILGAVAGLGGVWALVAGDCAPPQRPTPIRVLLGIVGAAAALWGRLFPAHAHVVEGPDFGHGRILRRATAVVAGLGHLLFETWAMPSAGEWAAIVALGLLPIGLALYLWDHGIKRGDLQALGVFSYVEPFLGVVLVVMLGRGDFGWSLVVAGVLIVGGATLAARSAWA